ncbi:hypothetical protein BIZ82_gp179 [Erwinia phage vB_EamM_EarlPhillipIV]|uniref:Uncharacterized protein n=1 Tax=Erwinia phage vB_EamM_EarlPhillipIV TaxID=1883372 RepID=A0A1B2ICN2_9CAUD|nr:hypothetical protein BIZ82_gp179 [Erwinia phage vB_EamM_EarlPhillipIV]ANZ49028.1 hypothetical protein EARLPHILLIPIV_179 [Erwinia phage vB_EamM_EarlPhillipIV]
MNPFFKPVENPALLLVAHIVRKTTSQN